MDDVKYHRTSASGVGCSSDVPHCVQVPLTDVGIENAQDSLNTTLDAGNTGSSSEKTPRNAPTFTTPIKSSVGTTPTARTSTPGGNGSIDNASPVSEKLHSASTAVSQQSLHSGSRVARPSPIPAKRLSRREGAGGASGAAGAEEGLNTEEAGDQTAKTSDSVGRKRGQRRSFVKMDSQDQDQERYYDEVKDNVDSTTIGESQRSCDLDESLASASSISSEDEYSEEGIVRLTTTSDAMDREVEEERAQLFGMRWHSNNDMSTDADDNEPIHDAKTELSLPSLPRLAVGSATEKQQGSGDVIGELVPQLDVASKPPAKSSIRIMPPSSPIPSLDPDLPALNQSRRAATLASINNSHASFPSHPLLSRKRSRPSSAHSSEHEFSAQSPFSPSESPQSPILPHQSPFSTPVSEAVSQSPNLHALSARQTPSPPRPISSLQNLPSVSIGSGTPIPQTHPNSAKRICVQGPSVIAASVSLSSTSASSLDDSADSSTRSPLKSVQQSSPAQQHQHEHQHSGSPHKHSPPHTHIQPHPHSHSPKRSMSTLTTQHLADMYTNSPNEVRSTMLPTSESAPISLSPKGLKDIVTPPSPQKTIQSSLASPGSNSPTNASSPTRLGLLSSLRALPSPTSSRSLKTPLGDESNIVNTTASSPTSIHFSTGSPLAAVLGTRSTSPNTSTLAALPSPTAAGREAPRVSTSEPSVAVGSTVVAPSGAGKSAAPLVILAPTVTAPIHGESSNTPQSDDAESRAARDDKPLVSALRAVYPFNHPSARLKRVQQRQEYGYMPHPVVRRTMPRPFETVDVDGKFITIRGGSSSSDSESDSEWDDTDGEGEGRTENSLATDEALKSVPRKRVRFSVCHVAEFPLFPDWSKTPCDDEEYYSIGFSPDPIRSYTVSVREHSKHHRFSNAGPVRSIPEEARAAAWQAIHNQLINLTNEFVTLSMIASPTKASLALPQASQAASAVPPFARAVGIGGLGGRGGAQYAAAAAAAAAAAVNAATTQPANTTSNLANTPAKPVGSQLKPKIGSPRLRMLLLEILRDVAEQHGFPQVATWLSRVAIPMHESQLRERQATVRATSKPSEPNNSGLQRPQTQNPLALKSAPIPGTPTIPLPPLPTPEPDAVRKAFSQFSKLLTRLNFSDREELDTLRQRRFVVGCLCQTRGRSADGACEGTICLCASFGVNCSGDGCECTGLTCSNPWGRHAFNQKRVDAVRQDILEQCELIAAEGQYGCFPRVASLIRKQETLRHFQTATEPNLQKLKEVYGIQVPIIDVEEINRYRDQRDKDGNDVKASGASNDSDKPLPWRERKRIERREARIRLLNGGYTLAVAKGDETRLGAVLLAASEQLERNGEGIYSLYDFSLSDLESDLEDSDDHDEQYHEDETSDEEETASEQYQPLNASRRILKELEEEENRTGFKPYVSFDAADELQPMDPVEQHILQSLNEREFAEESELSGEEAQGFDDFFVWLSHGGGQAGVAEYLMDDSDYEGQENSFVLPSADPDEQEEANDYYEEDPAGPGDESEDSEQ